MSEFPHLPLFVDAFRAKTYHLSRAERGMYLDILMLCWGSPGCRIPNEMPWITRKLMVSDDEMPLLCGVIAEFMRTDGNWMWNSRLLHEYEHVKKKKKQQSDRSKSRWHKEKEACGNDADTRIPRNAPIPIPISKKEQPNGCMSETSSDTSKPKRRKMVYPPPFEAFWQAYPTDPLMSKKEAAAAWTRLSEDDHAAATRAVSAFAAHCRSDPTYRPLHACRFLSQRRFEGFNGHGPGTGPPAQTLDMDPEAVRRREERARLDAERIAKQGTQDATRH